MYLMDYNLIACELTKIRRNKRVSQQKLADDIGVSRATINAFEKSKAGDVGLRKVLKIIDYFGYEVSLKQKSAFPTLDDLRES